MLLYARVRQEGVYDLLGCKILPRHLGRVRTRVSVVRLNSEYRFSGLLQAVAEPDVAEKGGGRCNAVVVDVCGVAILRSRKPTGADKTSRRFGMDCAFVYGQDGRN